MNKVEQQLGTPKSKGPATDTPPKFNTNTPKTGIATALTNTPKTGHKSSSNPLILLVGKMVFLDLNSSYKPLNKVKQCLNLIGAKIADCLSKDVDYVISNREATVNSDSSSSKTSPNALNIGSRSSFINRTQSILEKASKGFTTSDILSTARRLGIKVMNIVEIERHIEKYLNKTKKNNEETSAKTKTELIRQSSFQLNKLSTNQKIYKLKNPFLKIESVCKQYKPIYEEFETWHEINLDIYTSKNTSSPFQIYFSDDIKADDENEEEHINSQMISQPKNVFKSPASSKLPIDPSVKSNVLLNCSNNLSSNNVKNKISIFNGHVNTPGKSTAANSRLITSTNASKRKPTGYCECCKQRYDNLKQHLTSVTHENFDKNSSNFKELDEYIDGVLNFDNFLIRNNLYNSSKEKEGTQLEAIKPDIEETKEFAKEFNKKRQSLGISQAQVVSALNMYQEPVFDESALNRFEQLDITPRSAARMKPVLERWLNDATLKFGDRLKTFTKNQTNNVTPNQIDQNFIGCCNKKRKRFSFSSDILKVLNSEFLRNSQPSPTQLKTLSLRLKQEEEEITMWFTEKRINQKKNKKKFKQSNVLDGLLNSSFDNESSLLNSSPALETSNDQLMKFTALEKRPSKSLPGMWQQSTSVKAPCPNQKVTLLKHTDALNQISSSLTPIRMNPNYDMSSPSAQVLFTLNSNSFTIPNDASFSAGNTSPGLLKNKNVLASRLELINGTSQLQSIMNDENKLKVHTDGGGGYLSKSENSTDLSLCVDDSIFNAFCNDFSYEIVKKKT